MFRPIRTLALIGIAFVAGVLYERASDSQSCTDRGGEMSERLCLGVEE
ncbi:hypothetical protein R5H30_04825 [Sulfitobacter sp. D35]|nr:hypothetical protein [Sulfitobacter sp. D35]MDW4497295.1 hypothetical protein [Sulfitobacter sp. D35]